MICDTAFTAFIEQERNRDVTFSDSHPGCLYILHKPSESPPSILGTGSRAEHFMHGRGDDIYHQSGLELELNPFTE